jgi:hypothetical protein
MDRAIWSEKALWGTGVRDLKAIWGSKAIWGENVLEASRAIWCESVWADRAIWSESNGTVDLSSTALRGDD